VGIGLLVARVGRSFGDRSLGLSERREVRAALRETLER